MDIYPLFNLPPAHLVIHRLRLMTAGPVNPAHADSSPLQLRKLFIGGLNHDTTDEELGAYFSQWGAVMDAVVMRCPSTKHSRGFGFVTFASIFSVETALKNKPHFLGGKMIDSKRAIPREQMSSLIIPPLADKNYPSGCKIYLTGIQEHVHSVDSLRIYFETFGILEQVELLKDKESGDGYVVFVDKESADSCLRHNSGCHVISNFEIEVRTEKNMVPRRKKIWLPPRIMAESSGSSNYEAEDERADESSVVSSEDAERLCRFSDLI